MNAQLSADAARALVGWSYRRLERDFSRGVLGDLFDFKSIKNGF